MSRAAELLVEVKRCGAVAYRVGDRIRVRPAAQIPPRLLEELRQHREALLSLVPEQREADNCWRVMGAPGASRLSPIVINDWMTITNPSRCAEDTLLKLELVLAYKNTGHDKFFAMLVDGYVARLAACGIKVQVENFS